MAKITFLGTAASIPSKNRDNTSLIFSFKKELLLIDCPGSIVQKLIKTNHDYSKINKIILTHHHPDHIYGLPHLIHAQYLRNKQIDIFSNLYAIAIIKKLIKSFGLNKKGYPKITYHNVFKRPSFYSNHGLELKAITNKHCKQSFGIKFEFKNKSIVYSSDTAISKNIISASCGCAHLIHDCTGSSVLFKKYPALSKMHTNAKDLAKTFYKSGIEKITPIHFLNFTNEGRFRKNDLSLIKDKLLLVNDLQTIIF